MKFEMTDVEVARFKEFKEYIRREFGERHYKKAVFAFIFVPHGIGNSVVVKEQVSGEERNITDFATW